MEFYQTVGGRCFYEKTMPELNKNIEKLSQQLSEMNQNIIQKEADATKMTLETKAVVVSYGESIVDIINNCRDGWYFKELLTMRVRPNKEPINSVIILERVKPIEDNKDNELSIT